MHSNKTLLRKADIVAGNFPSGTLKHRQAEEFYQTAIDETSLQNNVRTAFRDEPSGDIPRLDFTGEPLVPADYYKTHKLTSATLDKDMTTMGVTPTAIKYKTVEFRGVVGIEDNAIEDNIEGEKLYDTVLDMAARKIGNHIEKICLMSDVNGSSDIWSGYGITDAASNAYDTYKKMYGWYSWAKANRAGDQGTRLGHLVDFSTLPHSTDGDFDKAVATKNRYLDRQKLLTVLNALPLKWSHIDPRDMRWITNPRMYWDYAEPFTERDTNLGDQLLQGTSRLTPFGIPFGDVAQLPVDLKTALGEEKHSFLLLTHYQNLIVVFQRAVDFETFRNPYKKQTDFIYTVRLVSIIQDEDMMVIADGLEWKGGISLSAGS